MGIWLFSYVISGSYMAKIVIISFKRQRIAKDGLVSKTLTSSFWSSQNIVSGEVAFLGEEYREIVLVSQENDTKTDVVPELIIGLRFSRVPLDSIESFNEIMGL